MRIIEAALYVSGKPLDVPTLAGLIKSQSEERVRKLARALMSRYENAHSAMEVIELKDGRLLMQLRPRFVNHVKRLATRQLLTPGPLRTLSFIAMKQPVSQVYVVRVRGKLAYGHVKELREMGLIEGEKLGRSKILRTTPSFADYFNLSHEPRTMRRQLEEMFEKAKGPERAAALIRT